MLHVEPVDAWGTTPDMRFSVVGERPFGHGRLTQLGRVRAETNWDQHGALQGVAPGPSGIWVSDGLRYLLKERLIDEDDPVRRLSSWPIRRSFVYFDVSDFSRYKPGQQALVIQSLASLARDESWQMSCAVCDAIQAIEAWLCIGDGYIFCFKDGILATYFAAWLARKIEEAVARQSIPVEFHFRASVHVGDVFCFWDMGRRDWNYIGMGINGGSRVLEAIGKDVDDVLFISNEVREHMIADTRQLSFKSRLLQSLQNRGRRSDKHGNIWRVYELNHMSIE
jgi:hypothetical protein